MTLRELVAGNLRRLRTGGGVRPEDLLPTARAIGQEWAAGWLAAVERGGRQLSAEQLLALPVVLGAVLRRRVTLAELLEGDAPVMLAGGRGSSPDGGAGDAAPAAPVPAEYLHEVITDDAVRDPFRATVALEPDPRARALARAAERLREVSRAGLGDVDIRALARAEAGAGSAEARLARRLAVPEVAVIAAATSLWGRSLTEERAARVAAGAAIGAVGRQLAADVAARIDQAASQAPAPVPTRPATPTAGDHTRAAHDHTPTAHDHTRAAEEGTLAAQLR